METQANIDMGKILMKLSRLQEEVDYLKQKKASNDLICNISVIEESLADIWDNEEDERWNNS